MYELCRVRLFSVGPAGARYSDVILDFRHVGAPIRAAAQEALFETGPAEVIRRPSPASVLFLENGGGKSVLIKLIFSVMLPGRRQVVGTTNTRVLEKFVRASDVAHVLLEWQHTETGTRVVTGKVSEWRGHVESTDPAKLVDAWYSFRPTAEFTMDNLPLMDGGRLVTLSGFRERFAEAHRREPVLQAVWETGHADWSAHLANLGLDTELFRYQRAMNAGEGEAAEAFTFRTDDAFVDFLLRAVIDEEDPRGLAEVVEGYAHKLSQRGALTAERDFVAGAIERLVPLASKHDQATAAGKLAADALGLAQRFRTEVALRCAAEQERLTVAQERQRVLVEAEQLAERELDRLGAVVLELRRLVAGMRLHAAEREKSALNGDLERARTRAAAWRQTETVLRGLATSNRAEGLRRLVGEREERARPALRARNDTARALARGLLEVAARAEAAAAAAQRQAQALLDREAKASQEYADALRTAEREREQARASEARIAEVRAAVHDRVRAGLLPDGAGVQAEADLAAQAAEQAETTLTWAMAEGDRLAAAVTTAGTASHEAQRAADAAETLASVAETAATRASEWADSLAGQPRLAGLLGVETVDPGTDAPAALELLATAIETADQDAAELRVANNADRRALVALGEGGLLPAPDDVTSTVDVLGAAGITAWAGWRYLSTMAPADRDAVLERYPHLVGGVVVNDPDQLEHAERVVARLLPRSIVAVGTTAAVHAGGCDPAADPPAGLAFLVPPNPAMYDEERAEAERGAITDRYRRRAERLAELDEQITADRELAGEIRRFRAGYPPGRVAELASDRDAAVAVLDQATALVTAREAELSSARAKDTELRQRIPRLRGQERTLRARADSLGDLAGQVANVGRWEEAAANATERARAADGSATRADERARELRGQAEAKQREADGQRRNADSCRVELARVHGGGSVSEREPVPAEPLEALRQAAEAAANAYAKVEVGGDLRAELEQAETAESQARADVETLSVAIRSLATELIASPEAADPPARAEATRRADSDAAALQRRVSQANIRVGELREACKQFTPQDRSLEPYGRPRGVEHGHELITLAQADLELARTHLDEARSTREDLDRLVTNTREAAQGFTSVLESLHGIAPPDGGVGDDGTAAGASDGASDGTVAMFDGDMTQARDRRTGIHTTLSDARALFDSAARETRQAADELVHYATDQRFDKANSPVRRQMIAVKRDELPAHAGAWERALRPRLRTLDDDLTQISRHRASIVTRLAGMVERALSTLRSAQRLSRLPDGLGDWSGQEFLRVKFAVDEHLLADRIGDVIDEASGQHKENAPKRDGTTLLLRGVHAAVPKGFRVEMLKPDAVLRTERLRVSEIRDVFSGGQQLTAAIILYCTLAALRANDRGQARQRHAGVLFLDNPIGRASAGYLLELQLAVAETLGVQLVYTTGLFDAGALSVFPLIIRLRNDADLRAGLKYLSVDSTTRRELTALGEPDGTARIAATRVFARPGQPAS